VDKLAKKEAELDRILLKLGGVVVAYSGGVDSAYLLFRAREVLKERVLAVSAVSEIHPEHEKRAAAELAQALGVKHIVVHTEELNCAEFTNNPPERCYYCKREFFAKLKEIAARYGYSAIIYGANKDDEGDFRPGEKAATENGARAPLQEAGLTKEEIRELSRRAGLNTWNKPSMACFSSRFPYGEKITIEKIAKIAAAEDYLRSLGFRQLRVRYHGAIARLELEEEALLTALAKRVEIVNRLKEIGFNYIALDLEGFRSGSMNETLKR
jgi:uncharacterized protein